MLAQRKVILMTRMAMFKQREGRKDDAAGRYFQVDYITHHIIGSVVCSTIVFMIVCALYLFSHFDLLMQNIYNTDLIAIITRVIRLYVVVTAVYCVLSAVIYAVRYYRMKKRIRKYSASLRRLGELTELERKT